MHRYIVFLRGINVSGHKKIKMVDLRELLSQKFNKVQTYIQSGNIVLETQINKKQGVADIVQNELHNKYGWDIPTIAITPSELKSILDENPYKFVTEEDVRHPYVCLFDKQITKSDRLKLEEISFPNEYFTITNNTIYLYSKIAANKSKLSNNLFEKKLNTHCTTRNWRTMNKLLELSSN